MSPTRSTTPAFHTLAFTTRETAERAFTQLIDAGVATEEVNLFVHAPPPKPRHDDNLDHAIDVGGSVGAGVSALAGGAGGVLAGLGLLAIPGVGPLLAVGPVAAALTGAITGGALGGFVGSLIGAGVSEAAAVVATKHLTEGRAIIVLADAAWTPRIAALAEQMSGLVAID